MKVKENLSEEDVYEPTLEVIERNNMKLFYLDGELCQVRFLDENGEVLRTDYYQDGVRIRHWVRDNDKWSNY
tara:strand:- start:250 stop:465 length:216 start_codon:yes stop_codon:yes gene_type:complete